MEKVRTVDKSDEDVYCALCEKLLSESFSRHPCFLGAQEEDLRLEGNKLYWQNFSSEEELEVLVEYNNVLAETKTKKRKPNLPEQSRMNKKHPKSCQQETPSIAKDTKGMATIVNDNLIAFLEIIREKPVIWDFSLPIDERGPYAVRKAWEEIAKLFPGWSFDFMRQKFSNMKGTYNKRKLMAPSGSPAVPRKEWMFEKYLDFLGDVVDPAQTISNVPPEASSSANPENEHATTTKRFGFVGKQARKSEKQQEPTGALEKMFAEALAKKKTPIQNWCEWLAYEIQTFADPHDRLRVQSKITELITQMKLDTLL